MPRFCGPCWIPGKGWSISSGICPRYSDIDTYHMMACAIDEAIRNNIAVGGNLKHMAGLDNFCWCDPVQSEKTPDGEYKLAQLVRANMALYDYTTAFGVPCISGKDSMKNDYLIGTTKISIPPTVLFSAVSVITDVRKCVTMDAKRAGDRVYVLGETFNEMGASEYFALFGFLGNQVPRSMRGRPRHSMKRWAGRWKKGWSPPAMTARTGGWEWPWRKRLLLERWAWKLTCEKFPHPESIEMTFFYFLSLRAGLWSRSIRKTKPPLKTA